MKIKLFSISVMASLFLGLASIQLNAQSNDIILTVEDENVTREDFESIFRKNNRDSVVTQESLDEYMELFINFKLKVREAREMGLDTNAAFVKELAGYRRQLARPYLIDSELLDELVEEAYARKQTEVKAAHILVKVEPNAAPEDTLKAWKKIMGMRDRIMKGEDFEKVARAKNGSEDPSVAQNGGDLGYFSAFDMVYPFEDAAYELKVGEVSQPVRTRYGYHLIKLIDKREARGEVEVAHIMVRVENIQNQEEVTEGEKRIQEIYTQLKNGAEFSDMALKYSDDKSTSRKGGVLPWFGTGKMVEEFEDAAFNTKPGEVSEPFMTQYGWHIVKGMNRRDVPDFESSEAEIRNRVSRDSRADLTKASFINKLRAEYKVELDKRNLKPVTDAADTSLYDGYIKVDLKQLSKVLMTIDGKEYTVNDFVTYLSQRKHNRKLTPKQVVEMKLADWEEDELLAYEDSRLESKHNAFRLLMNEYRDGILLFELTDQKVWSKAVQDSTGLQAYYEANKNNYMWPRRAQASIYACKDAKVAKALRKLLKKKKSNADIKAALNAESELNVRVEEGTFVIADKEILSKVNIAAGVSENVEFDGQTYVVKIDRVIEPEPKKLEEARGLVTADYQKYLEAEWIKSLRAKYKFKANEKVLHSIR